MRPCSHTTLAPSECRICWLYVNRPDYRKMWDAMAEPKQRPADCHSLLNVISDTNEKGERCGCQGKWLRQCKIYGQCTVGVSSRPGVRSCQDCPSYWGEVMLKPNQVNAQTPVDAVEEVLEYGSPGPWADGWSGWPNVKEAHLKLLNKFRDRLPAYPEGKYQGKGIVTCISAKPGYSSGKNLSHGYFPCGWVLINELRRLGCTLPITVAYLGDLELDPVLQRLLEPLGVTCIDLREWEKKNRHWRILAGWESKIAAILASPYEEVLFLDSDNVPVRNPEFLFDCPEYQEHGAILWPDVAPHDRKEWLPPAVWESLGMKYRGDVVDAESGQLLYHKKRHWNSLQYTRWINEHSDYYYKLIFGDKSSMLLGCHLANQSYYMIPQRAGWNGAALLQHAPPSHRSCLLFEHCVQNKASLSGYPRQGCLSHPGEIEDHLFNLQKRWDGVLWYQNHEGNVSDAEREVIKGLIGKRFKYTRFLEEGPATREIRLLEDNRIGRGADKCEFSWSLLRTSSSNILAIHSIDRMPTMLLRCDPMGVWRGEWLQYEKCPVTLEPIEGQ